MKIEILKENQSMGIIPEFTLLPISRRIVTQIGNRDIVATQKVIIDEPALYEALRAYYNVKIYPEKGKQIFSDVDPYGEENWEN